MKINLCKSVLLDGGDIYTNHSIRATVISTLDKEGFEARHIITLSSHKSESTVKEYATKCPNTKRKEMCESLSNALLPKNKKQPTSTVTSDTLPQLSVQDVKENLPTFDLQNVDLDTLDDNILANLVYDFPAPQTAPNITTNSHQNQQNKTKQNTNQTENNANQTKTANENTPTPQVTVDQNPRPLQIQGQNIPPPPPQVNTLVNSFTNNVNPRVPAMYFPHSTVTINYNIKN